jgi:excisionase family DNA binding protein
MTTTVRKGSEKTIPSTDVRALLKGRLALPVPEAAKLLGISSAAIRLMIHRGDLPGRKVGGGIERMTYIIPTTALLFWLDGQGAQTSEGAA